MKYQPVRNAIIALVVVGLGVGVYLWGPVAPAPDPPPAVVAETQALATPSAPLADPATPQPPSRDEPSAPAPPAAAAPAPASAPKPTAEAAPAPAAENAKARDPLLILARVLLDAPAKSEADDDYLRGQGPKFALYDDDRDGRWDRAKIDYERDGVWDETWTRRDGTVERELEVSGQRLVLVDEGWVLSTQ